MILIIILVSQVLQKLKIIRASWQITLFQKQCLEIWEVIQAMAMLFNKYYESRRTKDNNLWHALRKKWDNLTNTDLPYLKNDECVEIFISTKFPKKREIKIYKHNEVFIYTAKAF